MADEERIEFGEERRTTASGTVSYVPTEVDVCPDCGVRRGDLHERGCNLEQCPICGEPLVQCGHKRRVLD